MNDLDDTQTTGDASVSLDAWILFNAHPERNRRIFHNLLTAFDSPERILGLTLKELTQVQGVTTRFAELLLKQPETFDLEAEQEKIVKHGIRMIPFTHPDYPKNLKNISDPPLLLYLTGTLIPEDRFSIAVVGSRRNSTYGENCCRAIVNTLAKSGFTITSGMARGIDTLAHKCALRCKGRTIAVLGNGLDVCYPRENKELMKQIPLSGALLSEYPMTTPPREKNFPERNSVIAGLSLGVLVVEAAEKSGSLITARAGLEENRSVYAVPGNIFQKTCQGTNALLRQGAQLVRSGEDILEDLSFIIKGMIQAPCSDNIDPQITNLRPPKEGTL